MNDIFDPMHQNRPASSGKLRASVFLFPAMIVICFLSYEFLDIPIARFFAPHKGALTTIFEGITYFGRSTLYLIVSALAFIWFKFLRKCPVWANAAAFIFASIALSGIANDSIKYLAGRSRPNLLLSEQIYGFRHFVNQYSYNSFPSGHANTAAALFYSLYLIRDKYLYIYIPAASAIILSRVILDAHFLSDVIFGAYLAIVVTSFLKIVFEKKDIIIEAEIRR
jgi:membrane-associated phospholipid phosphatase